MKACALYFCFMYFQVKGLEDSQKPTITLDKPTPLTIGEDVKLFCLFTTTNLTNLRIKCTADKATKFQKINDTTFLTTLRHKLVQYKPPELCSCAVEINGEKSSNIAYIKLIVREVHVIFLDKKINCQHSTKLHIACKIRKKFPFRYKFLPWNHIVNNKVIRNLNSLFDDNLTSVLQVSSCSLADYGNYSCQVWIDYGQNKTATISQKTELTIYGKPLCLSSITLLNDNTGLLIYKVYSKPKIRDISFEKSGHMLEKPQKYSIDAFSKDIEIQMYDVDVKVKGQVVHLMINNLEEQDFDIYTAVVSNSEGTTYCTTEFRRRRVHSWFLREKITTSSAIIFIIVIALLVVYIRRHGNSESATSRNEKQMYENQPFKTDIDQHSSVNNSKNRNTDQRNQEIGTLNEREWLNVTYQNTFNGNYENGGNDTNEVDSQFISKKEDLQPANELYEDDEKNEVLEDVLFISKTGNKQTVKTYDYFVEANIPISAATDHKREKHRVNGEKELFLQENPTSRENNEEGEFKQNKMSPLTIEEQRILPHRYYNITDDGFESILNSNTTDKLIDTAGIGRLSIRNSEDKQTIPENLDKTTLNKSNPGLIEDNAIGENQQRTYNRIKPEQDKYDSDESLYEPVETTPLKINSQTNACISTGSHQRVDDHYEVIENEDNVEKENLPSRLNIRYSENYGYASVEDVADDSESGDEIYSTPVYSEVRDGTK